MAFESVAAGFKLCYPATWTRQQGAEVLDLVPARAGKDNPRTISLDVPSLPPHLPGMIRVHLVENGYLDDLRKQHKDVKVEEDVDRAVPDAKARGLRCTWKSAGQGFTEWALLMVHADRVYILTADSDAAGAADVKAAFETISATLQWLKK